MIFHSDLKATCTLQQPRNSYCGKDHIKIIAVVIMMLAQQEVQEGVSLDVLVMQILC